MIKATFHIIIAFSVYLSSGGFWMNNHYCQDELSKTNFYLAFGSCCSMESLSPCTAKKMSCDSNKSDEDKGCCENDPSFHKLEQDQRIEEINSKSIDSQVVASQASMVWVDNSLPIIDEQSIKYYSYTPPIIITDPQVWFETFLC